MFSRFTLFCSFVFIVLTFFWPRKELNYQSIWKRQNIEQHIAFVVDVSQSMNTLDIAPNSISRLEASKIFIAHFLESYPFWSYSLSVFAGSGNRKLPFTQDIELFQSFLKNISSEDSIKTGTDINKAFETWISNFSSASWGILYILTDGGEEQSKTESYKKQFQEKGISLVIIWVWSQKGWYIPTGRDVFWNIRYKTYKWEKVLTKRESKILAWIASQFDGKYLEVWSESDIKTIVKKLWNESLSWNFSGSDDIEGELSHIFIFFSFIFFLTSFCIDLLFLWKRF